jgi:hypothetical protein
VIFYVLREFAFTDAAPVIENQALNPSCIGKYELKPGGE